MAIKFNIEPYWDDYKTATGVDGLTPQEKYNKILFRPGHAIQARELTQLQSILQNQVSSIGDHLFKEGSVVIPGTVSIFNKVDYLKLSALNTTNISSLIGLEFTDGANNAKVIHAVDAEGSDPITLFVQYTSGSAKFADSTSLTSGSITATVDTSGFGSIVSVADGIYYIKKNFVIVKSDTIILSKYDTDVSYDVGLTITEQLVSSGDDESLNDNAQGTPNESAPGAHRYAIKTSLVKQAVNTNIGNFVLLARLESGIISKHARATDYSVIEDTLARRTFDESGNYTVNPFYASMKAHVGADDTKLTIGIEPSKAYVRGYEIQTLDTTNVTIDRARDSVLATDKVTEITHSNSIIVSSMVSLPDTDSFETINLKQSSSVIGTARVRSVESLSTNHELHLFDINFTSGSIDDVTNVDDSNNFSATLVSHNLSDDSLVYQLPYSRIKTCNSETDPLLPIDYNYRYETNRIVGTAQASSTEVIFYCNASGESFGSTSNIQNWIVEEFEDSSSVPSGTIIPVASGDINVDNNNTPPKVTITLSGYAQSDIRLVAPTIRTLEQKSKTKSTNTVQLASTLDFSNWQNLDHSDTLEVTSIMDGVEDITSHFDFDNGQTSTHYGVGKIRLKTDSLYTISASDIDVTYSYFNHSSGDFFTIDSYTGEVDYEDIPSWEGVELRSAVDFRPRMDNSGGNFTGTGASVSHCPTSGTQFETDIQYYLNRIDKVYIDKSGEFGVLKGVSDLNPSEPTSPKDIMVLYDLYIPAYTLNPDEVTINHIDNRRYTMRDIGKLESRINNLEYYTTLSLLEKEADSKQILDGSGLPRFKSGFLVDSFTDTTVGRISSNEYRAGIDKQTGTLRSLFTEGNAKMLFDSSSNCQQTGDLITLPYTPSALISQTQASGTINVNPYNVFNWTGTLKLTPATDEWKDIDRRPQVILNQDGVFDAMRDILNESVATGTVWNSWQTNWTGSSTRTSTRNFNWGWASGRDITTTTTRSGTRTRTGVNTSIGTENVTTNIGDRVVEVNFAPFMRSRWVSFEGTRLKPNSDVYAFFDDIDVNAWVNMKDLDNLSSGDQTTMSSAEIVGINSFTSNPLGSATLTTDANGYIKGSFFVPNNANLNFRTGDKKFLLTDSATNNNEETGTSASGIYSAKGLIETKENVVLSTRVPTIQRRSVDQSTVVTSTSSSSRRQFTWLDPLAQSIMIDLEGGAFVTSLELYFTAKSSNIPVQVQLRKMDQGIPTQEIIPFSDVTINASQVNTTGSTEFTFESPVYLQDGIEYCFVVLSNSDDYRIKYAEIGEEDENGNRISKQPYNGVMFKSQNASTWTPDQNKDLTFKLNRAVFDIASPKDLILKNKQLETRALSYDPLYTTLSSSDITVSHRDHGFDNGDSVTISGATGDINGIPVAQINTTHTVSSVKRDSYVITAATDVATSQGIDGGSTIVASQNIAWDNIYPLIQEITLPNTGMIWGVRSTSRSTQNTAVTYDPIIINQNYTPVEESTILAGSTESLYLKGVLSSASDNLSPIIDLDRSSVIAVSNRIDDNTDVAETDPMNGSALAKYITKTVTLDESSDNVKLYLDINRPSQTDIEVYYKTGSDLTTFDNQDWVLENKVIPFSDDDSYKEIEYAIDPGSSFTLFALKIVFTSSNTVRIPSVQNLRAIALLA